MLDAVLQVLAGAAQAALDAGPSSVVLPVGAPPPHAHTVALTRLFHDDGQVAFPADTVALALVSVEVELVRTAPARSGVATPRPPLSLRVVFAARDDDYAGALRDVDTLLRAFQERPYLTAADASLGPAVAAVTLSLVHLDLDAQRQLWALLGGRLLPSLVYDVRVRPTDPSV